MHWLYLGIAIIFEVMGTLSIKQATLSTSYIWSFFIIVFYVCSFTFMYYATKSIAIGTVYAIWAGLGTTFIVLLGWLVFKEEMNLYKIFGILMIIFGVILLKLQANS